MAYQIIIWINAHLDDEAFKSQTTLKDAIENIPDPNGKIKDFMDDSPDWINNTYKSDKQQPNPLGIDKGSLNEGIVDKNESYIAELQAEIDAANRETIKDVKIDTDYTEGAQTTLGEYLEARKDELEGEDKEEIDKVIADLESAKSLQELEDAIEQSPSVGSTRRKFGGDIADRLSLAKAEAAEKRFELRTEEEKEQLLRGEI